MSTFTYTRLSGPRARLIITNTRIGCIIDCARRHMVSSGAIVLALLIKLLVFLVALVVCRCVVANGNFW